MWVSVLVRGRLGEAGGRPAVGDGRDGRWALAHWSSSRTGSERDAISHTATRSTPAQACQSATALRQLEPRTPPDPKPIGTLLAGPPLSLKTGQALQEALKKLICSDGLSMRRDFRGSGSR